jgi:hypothetical protein
MIGVHEVYQFFAQPLDLSVVQNPDASQVAILVEKSNLLVAKPEAIPIRPVDRRNE